MDAGQPGISNRGEDLADEGVTASLLDEDKHADDAEQMGMSTTTEVARPQSAGLEMRWWTSTTAWLVMGIGLGMVIAAQRRLTDGPVLLSTRDSVPASDQASDSASSSPAGPGNNAELV